MPDPSPPAREAPVPSTEAVAPVFLWPKSIVAGEIGFLPPGEARVDLGATIVSLRPSAARAGRIARGGPTISISSATPAFAPPTRIVRPGQSIVLENGGPVVHRLFTPVFYEKVIALDPDQDSEPLAFGGRGPVRFYCSLHADETFVVFVEDAPYVGVVSESGGYELGPVSPGRYTLSIWSERVSGPIREVYVNGLSRTDEPIWLVPALIDR